MWCGRCWGLEALIVGGLLVWCGRCWGLEALIVGGLLVWCGRCWGLEALDGGGEDGCVVQMVPVGRSLHKEGVSQLVCAAAWDCVETKDEINVPIALSAFRDEGVCRPYRYFLYSHQWR